MTIELTDMSGANVGFSDRIARCLRRTSRREIRMMILCVSFLLLFLLYIVNHRPLAPPSSHRPILPPNRLYAGGIADPRALPVGFWGIELEFYALPSDIINIGRVVEQFGGKSNVTLGQEGHVGHHSPKWILQMDEDTLTNGYVNAASFSTAQEVMDAVGCKENIEQRLKVYQGLSEILPGSAQSLEESGDVPQSSYAKGKPTSCQIGQAKVTSITPMSEILARSTKAIASPCCGCHVKIPAVWGHLLPELSSSKHCCPRTKPNPNPKPDPVLDHEIRCERECELEHECSVKRKRKPQCDP